MESQIKRGLPAAVNESRNEIHSQLQTNGKVPTLFAFRINPSLEIVNQSHIMRVLCKSGLARFLPMNYCWRVLHKSFPWVTLGKACIIPSHEKILRQSLFDQRSSDPSNATGTTSSAVMRVNLWQNNCSIRSLRVPVASHTWQYPPPLAFWFRGYL